MEPKKIVKPNGTVEYRLNEVLHREDGPAVEYPDGRKDWYLNGRKHRVGGPAVESSDYRMWYLNGKLHREDGPAMEYDGGLNEWFVNDTKLNGPEINRHLWQLSISTKPENKEAYMTYLKRLFDTY